MRVVMGANPADVGGATVLVRTLGCVVAVRFPPGSASVDSFRDLWSRAVIPDGTPADTTVDVTDAPDDEVQHSLSMQVTLAAIEVRSRDLWMIHAAGLADPATGATVALVAPSGTGKSTAAQHLGRLWAYLSDETVGIDRSGNVLAHPKPLSRVVAGSLLKRQVGPDEAGLLAPQAPTKLAAVVLLERDGSAAPVVEPVRRSEAIARIAAQTSFLGRLPQPLHFVNDALGSSEIFNVRYAEIADLEPLIADLMAFQQVVEPVETQVVEPVETPKVVEPVETQVEPRKVVEPVETLPKVVEPQKVVEPVETLPKVVELVETQVDPRKVVEPGKVVELVETQVDPPSESGRWSSEREERALVSRPPSRGTVTKAHSLPHIDALDLDDERLVMVGDRVILLSPVASVVHRLLDPEPVDLAALLDRVAEELPLPPEPEQALRTVLEQLAAESLVAIVA